MSKKSKILTVKTAAVETEFAAEDALLTLKADVLQEYSGYYADVMAQFNKEQQALAEEDIYRKQAFDAISERRITKAAIEATQKNLFNMGKEKAQLFEHIKSGKSSLLAAVRNATYWTLYNQLSPERATLLADLTQARTEEVVLQKFSLELNRIAELTMSIEAGTTTLAGLEQSKDDLTAAISECFAKAKDVRAEAGLKPREIKKGGKEEADDEE